MDSQTEIHSNEVIPHEDIQTINQNQKLRKIDFL
jgi:hypothetical protein